MKHTPGHVAETRNPAQSVSLLVVGGGTLPVLALLTLWERPAAAVLVIAAVVLVVAGAARPCWYVALG